MSVEMHIDVNQHLGTSPLYHSLRRSRKHGSVTTWVPALRHTVSLLVMVNRSWLQELWRVVAAHRACEGFSYEALPRCGGSLSIWRKHLQIANYFTLFQLYIFQVRDKSLSSKMLKIHKQVEDLANSARCISGLGGGLIKSAAP